MFIIEEIILYLIDTNGDKDKRIYAKFIIKNVIMW